MSKKTDLIGNLLRIDNKEGTVLPYKFNRMQKHFADNKSNRNIILKHRQGGMSSSILADMFLDCITIPNTICAVTSHETRATQRLLDRVQFYYANMGNPKPMLGSDSRSEKTFPDMNSSIYIGTAGARAFGRGDTIRKALMSELSFYEDAEKVLTGVEDAVPITGELTIECTPNGEDNIFYDRWVKAREGKSPYKPFFFPWWWSDDYYIAENSPYALPEDRGDFAYTAEEEDLVKQFHINQGQVRWRRWKMAEKGGLFYQEYPEDEVSCFIVIGDPVFDQYTLNQMAQGAYEGEHHEGGWQFWQPPEPGLRYIIGGDSSAGVPGGSYSAAAVINDRWEVVATYQGRPDPHTFALILKHLGTWYNDAMIAVERNFTGYAVLSHMTDYGNIYMQRDFTTGKVTAQKGWWTNEQTKEHMRTVLKDKLGGLKVWDTNLIRQMRGYRYIKLKAEPQTFDDLVIALMIACVVKKVEGGARGYQGAVAGYNW